MSLEFCQALSIPNILLNYCMLSGNILPTYGQITSLRAMCSRVLPVLISSLLHWRGEREDQPLRQLQSFLTGDQAPWLCGSIVSRNWEGGTNPLNTSGLLLRNSSSHVLWHLGAGPEISGFLAPPEIEQLQRSYIRTSSWRISLSHFLWFLL